MSHADDVKAYIAGVLNGSIVTGRLERLAVHRHCDDERNAESRGYKVDLDKIDELLETWRRRAMASYRCGYEETSEVGRASCTARFWTYFNCINELRTALGLPGLGSEE